MQDYWESYEYNTTYHLYNKSIGGRKLFIQEEDYFRFLNKYQYYFGPYTILYAYCLIPNHFHFMFRIKMEEDFSRMNLRNENSKAAKRLINGTAKIDEFLTDQTRRWFSSTALFLNHKYDLTGQVFLEKSKRISIKSIHKFYDLLCYIHHNPMHHGLTKTFKDWPYSTYSLYLQSSPVVASSEVYSDLGNGNKLKGEEYFFEMHENYKMDFDWESFRMKL